MNAHHRSPHTSESAGAWLPDPLSMGVSLMISLLFGFFRARALVRLEHLPDSLAPELAQAWRLASQRGDAPQIPASDVLIVFAVAFLAAAFLFTFLSMAVQRLFARLQLGLRRILFFGIAAIMLFLTGLSLRAPTPLSLTGSTPFDALRFGLLGALLLAASVRFVRDGSTYMRQALHALLVLGAGGAALAADWNSSQRLREIHTAHLSAPTDKPTLRILFAVANLSRPDLDWLAQRMRDGGSRLAVEGTGIRLATSDAGVADLTSLVTGLAPTAHGLRSELSGVDSITSLRNSLMLPGGPRRHMVTLGGLTPLAAAFPSPELLGASACAPDASTILELTRARALRAAFSIMPDALARLSSPRRSCVPELMGLGDAVHQAWREISMLLRAPEPLMSVWWLSDGRTDRPFAEPAPLESRLAGEAAHPGTGEALRERLSRIVSLSGDYLERTGLAGRSEIWVAGVSQPTMGVQTLLPAYAKLNWLQTGSGAPATAPPPAEVSAPAPAPAVALTPESTASVAGRIAGRTFPPAPLRFESLMVPVRPDTSYHLHVPWSEVLLWKEQPALPSVVLETMTAFAQRAIACPRPDADGSLTLAAAHWDLPSDAPAQAPATEQRAETGSPSQEAKVEPPLPPTAAQSAFQDCQKAAPAALREALREDASLTGALIE